MCWSNCNKVKESKKLCRPPVIQSSGAEVMVPIQSVLVFYVKGLLEAYPDLVDQLKSLVNSGQGWEFFLDVKYGNDGLGMESKVS